MDASLLLLFSGICVIGIVGGMALYPLLQAFNVIECNCDKSPEDKWNTSNS